MMSKKITSCICTHASYTYLDEAIRSLVNQFASIKDYNIIVQDNSHDQSIARLISNKYKNIEGLTYHIQKAGSLSESRNICLDLCDTEYIHYMDDDAIAEPQLIRSAIGCFERTSCDCIGGKTKPLWREVNRPKWLSSECVNLLSMLDWGDEELELKQHSNWIVGANMAFRKKNLPRFDESLGRRGGSDILLSNEEALITKEIWENGGKVFYSPSMSVGHIVDPKRVNKKWFLERKVWQAISDKMSGVSQWQMGSHFKERVHAGADALLTDSLISHASDEEGAEEFDKKLKCAFNLVRLAMNGFEF